MNCRWCVRYRTHQARKIRRVEAVLEDFAMGFHACPNTPKVYSPGVCLGNIVKNEAVARKMTRTYKDEESSKKKP